MSRDCIICHSLFTHMYEILFFLSLRFIIVTLVSIRHLIITLDIEGRCQEFTSGGVPLHENINSGREVGRGCKSQQIFVDDEYHVHISRLVA